MWFLTNDKIGGENFMNRDNAERAFFRSVKSMKRRKLNFPHLQIFPVILSNFPESENSEILRIWSPNIE